MKSRIICIVLLFLIFNTDLLSQSFTIMTYNIRYDNPADSINNWKYRKVNLCRLIQEESPDLLGVQEALSGQVKDLDSLLKGYEHFGVGRDDGKDKGEYAAIYYKSGRFRQIDGGNFWLSTTPEIPGSMGWDAACTRIVTWVKLQDNSTGKVLFHFNTHFDHMGVKARKESARLLKRRIKQLAGKAPVAITGDFNVPIDSKPMKILRKGRLHLKDSRAASPVVKAPFYTYATFWVNGKHEEVIDHIFTNKSFIIKDYKVREDNTDGRFFSDHLPVIVKTELGN